VDRLIAILGLSILIASCQNNAPVVVVSPSPSPSPHAAATDAVLQSSEVPAGLSPCLGSGPIDVYITTLANADATLPIAAGVAGQWGRLRLAGATSGAISLFTSTPAACSAELATTSNAKSVAAFVAEFTDSGQADRAWEAGIFGFMPPAPGELPAGVTRGTGTGLGLSSWTYDRSPVHLASWHKSVFVALVVVSNLDAATFKAATTAIDARLS
jgi:hypothetical protein